MLACSNNSKQLVSTNRDMWFNHLPPQCCCCFFSAVRILQLGTGAVVVAGNWHFVAVAPPPNQTKPGLLLKWLALSLCNAMLLQ